MGVRKTNENIEKPFSTKPKIRRKKTGHRSVERIAQALVDIWYPETEVSYEAMDKALLTRFKRYDRKTRLAYLGRAATRQVEQIEQQIRYRKSGTVTHKDHKFVHKLPAKKGYVEILGLATLFTDKKGKARFRLHHTIQETLPSEHSTQRVKVRNESKKFSLPFIDDLECTVNSHVGTTPRQSGGTEDGEKREILLRERENQSSQNIHELTPEEKRVLETAARREVQ